MTPPPGPLAPRRGFSLVAMLLVLMLLGVFALIAGQLFISVFRVTQATEQSQTRAIRFEGMMRLLRQDVWNARRISSADPKCVVLDAAGASRITWRVSADQTATRVVEPANAGSPDRLWPGLGADLSFTSAGPTLLVHVRDGPVKRQDEIPLVSQLLLAAWSTQ